MTMRASVVSSRAVVGDCALRGLERGIPPTFHRCVIIDAKRQ